MKIEGFVELPPPYERDSIFIETNGLRIPGISEQSVHGRSGMWATHQCRYCRVAVTLLPGEDRCPSCQYRDGDERCQGCAKRFTPVEKTGLRYFKHPITGAPDISKPDARFVECPHCRRCRDRDFVDSEKFIVARVGTPGVISSAFCLQVAAVLDRWCAASHMKVEAEYGDPYEAPFGWIVYACKADDSSFGIGPEGIDKIEWHD